MIKGAVPGAKGGGVTGRDAVKRRAPDDLPLPAAIRAVEAASPEAPVEAPVEAPAEGGEE